MSGHQFIPTQDVIRPAPAALDLSSLGRAVEAVGVNFPAVGAWLAAGWIAS